jgi:hypothetical protein
VCALSQAKDCVTAEAKHDEDDAACAHEEEAADIRITQKGFRMTEPEYKALLCSHIKKRPNGHRVGVPAKVEGYVQWQCINCAIRSIRVGLSSLVDMYLGDLKREGREQFDQKLMELASKTSLSSKSDVVAA